MENKGENLNFVSDVVVVYHIFSLQQQREEEVEVDDGKVGR